MRSESHQLLMPRRSRGSIPRVDRFLLCLSLLVVGLCFRPTLSFAANRNLAASFAAGRATSATDERGIVRPLLYDNANRPLSATVGTGSTRALLHQNGVGLSRGTYSAWGSSTGYSPGTPLAWNGRAGCYTDPETGLVLMGARYYSPSIGRFISRDPAGFSAGINLYAYCGGDPIDYLDPLGLDFTINGFGGSPFLVFSAQGTEQGLNAGADAVTYVFTLGKYQPSAESWNTPGFGAAVGAARVGQIALAGATAGAFTAPAALAAGATMPALAAANPQVVAEESQEVETLCTQVAGQIEPGQDLTALMGNSGLRPLARNKISASVVNKIAASLREEGFRPDRYGPDYSIRITPAGTIAEGHHRLIASVLTGVKVPAEYTASSAIDRLAGSWGDIRVTP